MKKIKQYFFIALRSLGYFANAQASFVKQITGRGDIHLFENSSTINEKQPSSDGKLIQF